MVVPNSLPTIGFCISHYNLQMGGHLGPDYLLLTLNDDLVALNKEGIENYFVQLCYPLYTMLPAVHHIYPT